MGNPHQLGQQHQPRTLPETPSGAFVAGALTVCGVVLAALLLGPIPVEAETGAGCIAGDWINEVAHFVAVETRSDVPQVCVRFVEQQQLNARVPAAVAGRAHGEMVAAVYVPASAEILLAEDLESATPLARSYLAHEMVHAQQFARHAHEHASCHGALEGEAYNIQALYLHTYASHLREEAVLLQVLGMFQGTCGYSN